MLDSDEDSLNIKDVPEGDYIIVKVNGKTSIRNYAELPYVLAGLFAMYRMAR